MSSLGWQGVDLDGSLAFYDGWKGIEHIGEPIPKMAERVRKWIADGVEVRIMTARVCGLYLYEPYDQRYRDGLAAAEVVRDWTEKHFGVRLPVTAVKDFSMISLWDDRAIQLEENTGRRMDGRV